MLTNQKRSIYRRIFNQIESLRIDLSEIKNHEEYKLINDKLLTLYGTIEFLHRIDNA